MEPQSIAGQVLALYECGYSPREILLEMKSRPGHGHLTMGQVQATLRKVQSRSRDSQLILGIHEMLLEVLAILREIQGMSPERVASRMRTIEKRDLPRKLGAAVERLTPPS